MDFFLPQALTAQKYATERLLEMDNLHLAHALFIRSKTIVNPSLLQAMPALKYIGSATAGFDHFQLPYKKTNPRLYSASGCNSRSVAEYVVAVLMRWLARGLAKTHDRIAIVGFGHVGSKVACMAMVLGFDIVVFDPNIPELEISNFLERFLAQRKEYFESVFGYTPKYIVAHSVQHFSDEKIITFHTPLTNTGSYPTYNFIPDVFQPVRESLCINTSRGPVLNFLKNKSLDVRAAALDVFPDEPNIQESLQVLTRNQSLEDCIVTPHIAGYSWEGKINGTVMVINDYLANVKMKEENDAINPSLSMYDYLNSDHNDSDYKIDLDHFFFDIDKSKSNICNKNGSILWHILDKIMENIVHLQADHDELITNPDTFLIMRKKYPVRREFSRYFVSAKKDLTKQPDANKALSILDQLGFQVQYVI